MVPAPHPSKGQVPVAFVVRRAGTVTESALKEYFLARGPAYAHPRAVHFVDALPLAGSGKPDRQALIALAQRRGDPPTAPYP